MSAVSGSRLSRLRLDDRESLRDVPCRGNSADPVTDTCGFWRWRGGELRQDSIRAGARPVPTCLTFSGACRQSKGGCCSAKPCGDSATRPLALRKTDADLDRDQNDCSDAATPRRAPFQRHRQLPVNCQRDPKPHAV